MKQMLHEMPCQGFGDECREAFPMLNITSNGHPFIYLNNAATALTPQSVLDAMDEYYKEFFQVIEFLLNDKEKMNHFSEVRSDYSVAPREVIQGDAAVLHLKKKAEDEMYGLMCRMEMTKTLRAMDIGEMS